MNLSSFSQSLEPIVYPIDGEIYFCFTSWQSKYIAKSLEKSRLQQKIIIELESKNKELTLIQSIKDTSIVFLEKKTTNQSLVIDAKNMAFSVLEVDNKKLTQKVKRKDIKNTVFGGVILVLVSALIIK